MASVTSSRTRTQGAQDGRARRGGRGRVLTAALEHVEMFPVLEPARERALELISRGVPPVELAEVVESDVGLAIIVLRTAAQGPAQGTVASAREAVEISDFDQIEGALREADTHSPLERKPGAATDPERFRLHSLSVQRAADAVVAAAGSPDGDVVAVTALLHDCGRLVLARLHAGYAERFDRRLGSPEERIAAERRELGIDHALVGGVLARRWRLSPGIATAIERHHSDEGGVAGMVRLADMLAAHLDGYPLSQQRMIRTAAACGLDEDALAELLYRLPRASAQRRRSSTPCPLSARELEVLHGLAEGKVYKQIALELGLSTSTVRTHLHNVYGKLGAVDRAQAVLIASERGWL
jgi:putative nucleotidyltransferase with HDIG domain